MQATHYYVDLQLFSRALSKYHELQLQIVTDYKTSRVQWLNNVC